MGEYSSWLPLEGSKAKWGVNDRKLHKKKKKKKQKRKQQRDNHDEEEEGRPQKIACN